MCNISTKNLSINSCCSDQESPQELLQSLRLKNADRIIVGHLNINSIRKKIDLLGDIIQDKVDILLVSETKINDSFPTAQFKLNGFDTPYRLDRTKSGGGLLFYFRKDITTKRISLVSEGIECILVEMTISKKKWFIAGLYNPHKKFTSTFLKTVSKNLDHYSASYDNIILIGDFNCEMSDTGMEEFCSLYDLKSLIKTPTC